MPFDVGSLVRARGREWVVLPESEQDHDLLVLRPLGGTDDEVTGIYVGPTAGGTPFELVEPAAFELPDPRADQGDHLSCGLLRDAVRLGFRSGAGPFRSLARIAVEPRPYQLVPLLMALRQDPVRLLVADDVGIGKTVEALLIARELVDRGEVRGIAVLCPPHLAEQWQRAMRDQFHLDAALVLSSTAPRLERNLGPHPTLFHKHPFTVVSMDFIKVRKRRDTFVNHCPELVIVDEAHSCTVGHGGSQLRHELLRELVKRDDRHLVLVTATPHSGNPETFRSLLSLLDPKLSDLPTDLAGDHNRKRRDELARYYVQRRRGDIRAYMGAATDFPLREETDATYGWSPEYKALFTRVLKWCRGRVLDPALNEHRQRVRWWSALALLRALSSSPAAAESTLRNRATAADSQDVAQADAIGRDQVLDQRDESTEGIDILPGSQTEDDADSSERRYMLQLAQEVGALSGSKDRKLSALVKMVKAVLADGYSPIIFCRFINTVGYVADELAIKLKSTGAIVEPVTGSLPPEERERRVEALGERDKRVLVCTDCLSEGINLQHRFDTVIHYDLSWNPTRHEQREGRVDRYGQTVPTVRAVTLYGKDNPVDGVVLNVLLRKHKEISNQLGVRVPVPMDTAPVVEALMNGLLKQDFTAEQLTLFAPPQVKQLNIVWRRAAEREEASRSLFRQHQLFKSIEEELSKELDEVRRALGDSEDVRRFVELALPMLGGKLTGAEPVAIDLSESPQSLRDALGLRERAELRAFYAGQPRKNAELLTRTHPLIEGLAGHVLETALDPELEGIGRRCGVVRTDRVSRRTTVLLLRIRFHIVNQGKGGDEQQLLAEDQVLAAFEGPPESPDWLPPDAASTLLDAPPTRNVDRELAVGQVERLLPRIRDSLAAELNRIAEERGERLLEAHRRVRKAARVGVRALRVEPHLPPDVLGVYIYMPDGGSL